MPDTLSPEDRGLYDGLLSYCDAVLYGANHAFILRRGRRGGITRREIVDLLRRVVTRIGNVPIPPSRASNDRDLYDEMLSLIRLARRTITHRFMHPNATPREQVVNNFHFAMLEFFDVIGCGDLCYHKERGCIECPPASQQ